MNKFSVVAILIVAVLVVEAASTRRGYYNRRIGRPMSRPFTQFNARARAAAVGGGFGHPLNNYISMPRGFNSYPMQFGPSPMGHLPDGEYRTAYGIASVDGSDVSMDAY